MKLVGYVAVFLLAAPAAGYTVGHAAAARPVGTADAARLTRSVRVPIVIDNSPPVILTVEPEELDGHLCSASCIARLKVMLKMFFQLQKEIVVDQLKLK